MNVLLVIFFAYLSGVIIMAIITRYANAKEKSKHACLEPSFSLLSWLGVVLYFICSLDESAKDGFIAKLLNYTNKE
jgi:hypothetical protein